MGSLYWRISYGLVNIIYLVNYCNYSLNHISGLDMENLKTQPTNLLITDSYPNKDIVKKGDLLYELKNLVSEFHQ